MTWNQLKRLINPNTNPALIPWLFSAALTAWQAFETAPGPLSWAKVGRVLGPVVIGLAVGYQRSKTTPVADPKDGIGQRLITFRELERPDRPDGFVTFTGPPVSDDDAAKLRAAVQTPATTTTAPATTTTGGAS